MYGCECYDYVQELRSRVNRVEALQFDYVPEHLNACTAKKPSKICKACALLLTEPIERKSKSSPLKRYLVSEEPQYVWDDTAYYGFVNAHCYEGRRSRDKELSHPQPPECHLESH